MMWIRYRRPDVTIEVKNATTGVGFSVSGKGWSQDLIAKRAGRGAVGDDADVTFWRTEGCLVNRIPQDRQIDQ